jgi:outer membrane protein assembly factor BamB
MKIPGWMAAAGLLLLAVQANGALAEAVAWRAPVSAEMGQSGNPESSYPFFSEAFNPDMPTPAMRFSSAGEPGFVLSGAGLLEPYPWNSDTTPYVAKVASRDGHVLWRWRLVDGSATRGRIQRIAIDSAGDVIAVGNQALGSSDSGLLLVKLDGASGTVRWRVVGASGTAGSDIAVDAQGDVFVTRREPGAGPNGQTVSRYAGATGTPSWSTVLPSGETTWDDFRIAVDAQGAVIAGGFFTDESVPAHGIQLAKLEGATGAQVWTRRLANPASEFGAGQLQSLHVTADGDLLIYGSSDADPLSLYRLNGTNGATRWHQPQPDFQFNQLLVDATGRLFIAGGVAGPDSTRLAEVRRLDPATGVEVWHADYTAGFPWNEGEFLHGGSDGSLLLAWASGDSSTETMHASALSPETGDPLWQVAFGRPDSIENGIQDIAQGTDGSVFVGASTSEASSDQTWTLYKLTGPSADDIFANGYDR